MNSRVQAVAREPIPETEAKLEALFEHFTTSSRKLEERYEILRRESEELRAQLRKKELEIQQAQKLATLGETAAAIAHEVRNPLGAVKLFVSLLKKELPAQGSASELIREINKGILAVENVVSNILQFSRTEQPTMAPLNLHSLIADQVRQVMLGQNRATVRVSQELSANPFIYGNEHGLRRVITNLLMNSIQALKGSGSIALLTENTGNAVRLTVHDSGPGFAPKVAESLFEPFTTTKNEGTGLGLAIVKRIVESHGGTVCARNNHGAEITIELPRRGTGA